MNQVIFRLISLTLVALGVQAAFGQGRIIVQLRDGHTPQELTPLFPVDLTDVTADGPFALYTVHNGSSIDQVESGMRSRVDLVVFAEDDMEAEAPENRGAGKGSTIGAVFDPNSAYNQNAALFQQINFKKGLSGFVGRQVRVAVLDTGVSAINMFLRTRVVAGLAIASDRADWLDFPTSVDSNGNGTINDGLGHGSMVAGIVCQLAPQAKLIVARIADSDGMTSAWNIVKGLSFACANGAELVNISMGSIATIPALGDVIEGWVEPQGVIVVAPAGNNSWEGANNPAEISSVVCVTGVDDHDIKAPFSNWDNHARQSAPATGIKSCWWDNTMGVWSGTSFAAPLVVGALADGLRFRPRLEPLQVPALRDLIEVTGDDIDSLNPNYTRKLGPRLNYAKLKTAVVRF